MGGEEDTAGVNPGATEGKEESWGVMGGGAAMCGDSFRVDWMDPGAKEGKDQS